MTLWRKNSSGYKNLVWRAFAVTRPGGITHNVMYKFDDRLSGSELPGLVKQGSDGSFLAVFGKEMAVCAG